MKTIFYNKGNGEILFVISGVQDYQSIKGSIDLSEDNIGIKLIENLPYELGNSHKYKILGDEFIRQDVDDEIIKPEINPLEERIQELENIIDIILGGIDYGI